jgi:hypothetical protein
MREARWGYDTVMRSLAHERLAIAAFPTGHLRTDCPAAWPGCYLSQNRRTPEDYLIHRLITTLDPFSRCRRRLVPRSHQSTGLGWAGAASRIRFGTAEDDKDVAEITGLTSRGELAGWPALSSADG